jgi:ABC-type transport system involved in multi-copper enzyme maturation permease subunit
MLLAVAGLFALLGICEPFVRDLPKWRCRRIWALSKLAFKEAVRSRVLWVFLIIALPFLFPVQWFYQSKPSDELRNTVEMISLVLMILVLAPAILLGSFYGIPNDVKNQTIHTVVTKPVERFEIVLGRFFGYTALMTLVLGVMTVFSLLLIGTTNFNEKALEETAKARVPVRGKLEFKSRKVDFEGTNVGREFDYRKYIAGHPESPQRAVWNFPTIPAAMADAPGDWVPVEFTFDVFRLTKGEENKGVLVTFRFVTHNAPQAAPKVEQKGEWQWAQPDQRKAYEEEFAAAQKEKGVGGARPGTPGWAEVNRLAEKYGFYEIRGKEVFDYQVMGVEIPTGLFKNALRGDPGTETGRDGKVRPKPRLSVYVKCESSGQLLGMAEPDLYLLEENQSFYVNFVKGMIGLWCRLCIVIALAVACSTYLSAVLSLLAAAIIFLLGYATDHLNDLATHRNIGGGPFESMSRLVRTEQPTTPLSDSAGAKVLQGLDFGWAWVVRRIQNVIPDVESFTWTDFVSEGFNINAEYLVINLVVTLGYLLPWAVLAYYLMKSREVAN